MDRLVFESIIKHILQEIPNSTLHDSMSDPRNYQYITTQNWLWLASVDYYHNQFAYYKMDENYRISRKLLNPADPDSIGVMLTTIKELIHSQNTRKSYDPPAFE